MFDEIAVQDVCTEEELLELALFALANRKSDDRLQCAEGIITRYIMCSNDCNMDIDKIETEIERLLLQYIYTQLAEKGALEASFDKDGNVCYNLTGSEPNVG